MGAIWFLGFLGVLVWQAINAGIHPELVSKPPSDYDVRYRGKKEGELEVNFDKTAGYVFLSLGIAVAWMLVLPAYGLYRLGRKIRKKKSEHPKET